VISSGSFVSVLVHLSCYKIDLLVSLPSDWLVGNGKTLSRTSPACQKAAFELGYIHGSDWVMKFSNLDGLVRLHAK